MATLNPATSLTNTAPYSEKWFSIYDAQREPKIWKELVQVYGNRMGMFDFTELAGNTFALPARSIKIFEEVAFKRLIELGDVGSSKGIAANAAGANITFKLAATEYDSNGYGYLRVNDNVIVPKLYMAAGTDKDRLYRVVSTSGSGTDVVYTAAPYYGSAATSDVASRITTDVPVGTKLALAGNAFGAGGNMPTGRSTGSRNYTCTTTITKDKFVLEGGIVSQQQWLPFRTKYGTNGVYNKAMLEHEFSFNDSMNMKMFMGENNENTAANYEAGALTGNAAVLGSKGLLQTLTEKAQKKSYTDAWQFTDFDDTKQLLISQYVGSEEVLMYVGDLLNKDMEAAGLDATKEFSGGTDLTQNFDQIGITYRKFLKNGIKHVIREVANLSDPNGLGAAAYQNYYRNMGIIIPTGTNKITMAGEAMKLNNIAVGYVKNGNEDRTRVINVLNGTTGINAGTVVHEGDYLSGTILSECAFVFTHMNQAILVEKA